MKKILFTGGGTVGHVTLNLLLIPKFIEDGWEVHYIGDKKGIEYQEIQKSGYPVTFHGIATGKLRRYFSWQNLLDIFKVSFGVLQSLAIMLRIRPQLLFSKGGFVSVPPVIAAKVTGVPVYIHESDLSMGLANKIAYKFATKMYTTFEPEQALPKVEHIGAVTKVKNLEQVDTQESKDIQEKMDASKPIILFVGGSAGAKVFNEFIDQHRAPLLKEYNVLNLTGNPALDELNEGIFRKGYVTSLYLPLMQLADVVVTRGGSNTLFELLAMQKLHLIVPLGKEASRGDQLENADYFVKKGYAEQIKEPDLTLESLQEKVSGLLENRDVYQDAMAASDEIHSSDEFYAHLLRDTQIKE